MAKRRRPKMTTMHWLALARSKKVQNRIANDCGIDNFHSIIRVVARYQKIDWDEAIAVLHMVYACMPTMLRNIGMQGHGERARLIKTLMKARTKTPLTHDELNQVMRFSNRSIVGASKLLHVICPEIYPIWDSRVAKSFLWKGVSRAKFSQLGRYVEYSNRLREWSKYPKVIQECSTIRRLNPGLSKASDLRLIELVLFRGGEK